MIIKCKKSKRFLFEIRIEDYLKNLESIGIMQELPLEVIVPCKICKEKEIYHIYKNRYEFIKNKEKQAKK